LHAEEEEEEVIDVEADEVFVYASKSGDVLVIGVHVGCMAAVVVTGGGPL
jgi:hypothetical protein